MNDDNAKWRAKSQRVQRNLNKAVRCALKSTRPLRAKMADILGCSLETFKLHIEQQFLPGMSWANIDEWHIDHIDPCRLYDLTRYEDQRKCYRYTNLRPLWPKDNYAKMSLRCGTHAKLREPQKFPDAAQPFVSYRESHGGWVIYRGDRVDGEYVVIQGPFPSREKAYAARDELKQNLGSTIPLTLDLIKVEIKKSLESIKTAPDDVVAQARAEDIRIAFIRHIADFLYGDLAECAKLLLSIPTLR